MLHNVQCEELLKPRLTTITHTIESIEEELNESGGSFFWTAWALRSSSVIIQTRRGISRFEVDSNMGWTNQPKHTLPSFCKPSKQKAAGTGLGDYPREKLQILEQHNPP